MENLIAFFYTLQAVSLGLIIYHFPKLIRIIWNRK